MAKAKNVFICSECGHHSAQWAGQCSNCKEWNTLEEETITPVKSGSSSYRPSQLKYTNLQGDSKPIPRIQTGVSEFDRVLGGGIVPGAAVLIGGDPGIGKSTLLLQVAAKLSDNSVNVAYISGEESEDQVKLRAKRLGLENSKLHLASTNDAFAIGQSLREFKGPTVAIIDSIQTMSMMGVESAPGTVSQIRACAHELIRIAKQHNVAIFFVGHVTKEGFISGPKVLEHAVDSVLYFLGDNQQHYRIIRAVKNRFGATDEIGVFAMSDKGLEEVSNPSALFLSEHRTDVAGSSVFAGIEGTRPLLIEVQALSAPGSGTPRRTVVGWDHARLSMILAVLQARCGLDFTTKDVFLNIVGGFKITEPAADMAVAAALISSYLDKPLPDETVFLGEIGLGGEIRSVSQIDNRLKEAQKLGFTQAIAPKLSGGAKIKSTMRTLQQNRLKQLLDWIQNN